MVRRHLRAIPVVTHAVVITTRGRAIVGGLLGQDVTEDGGESLAAYPLRLGAGTALDVLALWHPDHAHTPGVVSFGVSSSSGVAVSLGVFVGDGDSDDDSEGESV